MVILPLMSILEVIQNQNYKTKNHKCGLKHPTPIRPPKSLLQQFAQCCHLRVYNYHQQHLEHIWEAGGRLEWQLVTAKHSKLGIISKVLFHHYNLYSRLV